MEKLDLRYYLFHAIEPIYKKTIEGVSYEHLKCFLETKYIYPGKEVKKHLPPKYQKKGYGGIGSHVYFALTENNLLPKTITNRFGEFSAFSEEIIGRLAFMFDDNILQGQEIAFLSSVLSNEVLLCSRVPISMAKALYFPREFPLDFVERYQENLLEKSPPFYDIYLSENEKLRQKISVILEDPISYLNTQYQSVEEIREILLEYQLPLPIVSEYGRILNKKEETEFFVNHYEKVKSLIKK